MNRDRFGLELGQQQLDLSGIQQGPDLPERRRAEAQPQRDCLITGVSPCGGEAAADCDRPLFALDPERPALRRLSSRPQDASVTFEVRRLLRTAMLGEIARRREDDAAKTS
jgi:hypothetical protein